MPSTRPSPRTSLPCLPAVCRWAGGWSPCSCSTPGWRWRDSRACVDANPYALLLMPFTNVLGNFFVIVLAGVGGWLALRDLASVGLIATCIAYAQGFVQPLRPLANME